LFYLTPIMIQPSKIPGRRLALVLECNPLSPFLKLLREPILYARVPSLTLYGIAAGIVLLLGVTAILSLWIEERRLIFYL
jgi:ABC-type polysaccharide/polyol phosphate export permease